MTLIPILQTYTKHLQATGKSVHTVKAYTHDLTGFAHWFAQTTGNVFDSQAIGPRDIADYRSYLLTRGKKPATVNRRLVALQRFYKWASGRRNKAIPPTIPLRCWKACASNSSRASRPSG